MPLITRHTHSDSFDALLERLFQAPDTGCCSHGSIETSARRLGRNFRRPGQLSETLRGNF
jgi:hypothetical protein